ncbi:MAG: peptidoglycan DD-metalloendopeptidase family protein [Chloroflexota bacterium]|nr:peptidoglycan DD-metalloendopeptidase family protein [Chloroflexota bacterium]
MSIALLTSSIAVAMIACAPAAQPTVSSPLSLPDDRPSAPTVLSDPLNCTDRATGPAIQNVTVTTWSPDSKTLALVHTVNIPNAQSIVGYEEDQRVALFDIESGALRDIGRGNRPTWSPTGAYLAFWSTDGMVHVTQGGQLVAKIDSTQPGIGWNGDRLLYWLGDEIRVWDAGTSWILSRVAPDLEPQYPYDDAYFSADGTQFSVARYKYDGNSLRYVGLTGTGAMAPVGDGNTTFIEWSPRGATLLLRSATQVFLRAADGTTETMALGSFRGPVHGWTADGRLYVGAMAPTIPGGNAFDRFPIVGGGEDEIATIPNLLGSRVFSPDSRWFAGVSRTGLYTTQLELFRCGVAGEGMDLRSDTASRSRAQKITSDSNRFVRPVAGAFTQFLQGSHTGIDVAAPVGSILVASDDGVVDAVGWVPVGGYRVCVLHQAGLESCDYHTSLPLVTIGDHVVRGQPVALIGMTGLTTGPHVHWEVKLNGRIVNPLDQ